MTRTIIFGPEEFYHIYNRGTEKRDIFTTREDYNRFIKLLYIANQSSPVDLKKQGPTLSEITIPTDIKPLVKVAAYCLMPNHFHILLCEQENNGISKFMQKVGTGYTMYFNRRWERNGVLFQGKFKATHVNDDRYLAYLISYIHLNPIKLIEPRWKEGGIQNKKRAEDYLEHYKYSSYLDYRGKKRPENKIINQNVLPKYFSLGHNFKEYVTEWLNYQS